MVAVTANVECRLGDPHASSAAGVERAYFYVHHLISICSGAKHKCQQEARLIERNRICAGGCGSSFAHPRLMSEDECTNSKCSVVALCLFEWFWWTARLHVEDDLHDGHCYL